MSEQGNLQNRLKEEEATPPSSVATGEAFAEYSGGRGQGFDRIVNFSDGVFAIAITLLVLDISLGELPDGISDPQLLQHLLSLWPQFLAYAIGFAVIGSFWVAHHTLFAYIKSYDASLMWLNILFLAFVAIAPFPTSVIGRYGEYQSAQIFYAASVALTGLAKALIWLYASKDHRLIDADLSALKIREVLLRGLSVPIVFLVSIPFSWLGPNIIFLVWIVGPRIFAFVRQRLVR